MILQRLWAESNPDPRSTAPMGVTQNVPPILFLPETWSGAGETSRRSTGFYSINAIYGVTESSKGAKEALKECIISF